MLIPKKSRVAIYSYLFKEGVMVAKKDVTPTAKHGNVDVPNLYVLKTLQSLKSKGYVKETFSWQWYYWYLTNEGIEYLRDFLNLPDEIVPATLKKPKTAPRAQAGGRPGGDRDRQGPRGPRPEGGDKKVGPSGDFQPSFQRERFGGRGGDRAGDRSAGRGRDAGYRRDAPREGGFRGGRGRGTDAAAAPRS